MDPKQSKQEWPILNEAQCRSLSVSLSLLEEKLLLLKLLSEQGDYEGVIYRLQVDFDPVRKKELDRVISEIKSKISFLKDTFGLDYKTEHFSKLMHTTESYFWTVLMDEKSAKLKRYGRVSKKLSAILDPALEEIVQKLDTINRLSHAPSLKNPRPKD